MFRATRLMLLLGSKAGTMLGGRAKSRQDFSKILNNEIINNFLYISVTYPFSSILSSKILLKALYPNNNTSCDEMKGPDQ